MYDFFLCGGKNDSGRKSCSTEAIVLELSEGIPKNYGSHLFFDNWFSTFDVMLSPKPSGIATAATFRTSCLKYCPLVTDRELKSQGQDSHDYRTDVTIQGSML